MGKSAEDPPTWTYVLGVFLGTVFWMVGNNAHGETAKAFSLLLLPLTSTPYAVWLGVKPAESPQRRAGCRDANDTRRWLVVAVMVIVLSVVNLFGGLLLLGGLGFVIQALK